ncbi:MAG: hypothetical protein KGJ57_12680 [Sphingomonadales bacterium]|nr:hypothetical protein [Sphingomonadales bacterium]MDE2170268.1 hypothetical protein [Sphingomonadales bacterium]
MTPSDTRPTVPLTAPAKTNMTGKADTPEPANMPKVEAPHVAHRTPPVPRELSQDDPMPGADRAGD